MPSAKKYEEKIVLPTPCLTIPIHTLSCKFETTCSLKSSWSYLDSWLWGGHPMQILANYMFAKILLNLFGCMNLRGPSLGQKSGIHVDTCQLKVRPLDPLPPIPMLSSNTYFVLQFRNHMFSKIVLNLVGCMTLRGPSPGEKSGIHSDTCQLKVRHTLSCNLGTTCSPKSCWIYLDAWIWGVHPLSWSSLPLK